MNCSLYQASSTSESAGLPADGAWCRSGYCVAEWLPQMMISAQVGRVSAGLLRELRQRAVVVEAHHRREIARIQARRVLHRDQRVGVGRVAHDQHTHVAVGDRIERLALRREDLRVGEQQVLALHAGAARPRADEQRDVAVLEGDLGVVRRDDLVERRERAVVELHHHALQGAQRRRDFEQVQVDGLVGTEHLARGHAEGEGVADLACGAGDRDVDGGLHGVSPLVFCCLPRRAAGPHETAADRAIRNVTSPCPRLPVGICRRSGVHP